MIELGPYLQKLESLNVSSPLQLITTKMSSFALYHGLSFTEGLDRFVAEAESMDAVIRQNHQDIMEVGLGAKVLRAAYLSGAGEAFAERLLVIRDGWVLMTTDETRAGIHPNNPLSITNRYVYEDISKIWAPYTHIVGRPNALGELWLYRDITVDEYDVVATGFRRLRELETTEAVTWMGLMDTAGIPHNILNGFEQKRNRYPVEYTSVLS